MKHEKVFFSEGSKIAADLYLPDGYQPDNKLPGIVLCHGFAGIKELLLPSYAKEFVKDGFAALTFDYRGFGGSEGQRGRLMPWEQIADIRNAVTFMQSLPEVDATNIGLWGSSFGAANAICVAALDSRVKCIVGQLAFGNGERLILGDLSAEEKTKLMATLNKAWARTVTMNKSLMLSPDQILTDEDSKAFYKSSVEKYPGLKTRIPLSTLRAIIEYKPEELVDRISPRGLLLIAAENDVACPLSESESIYAKAKDPKQLLVLRGVRHYEVYEGDNFQKSVSSAVEWFKTYLQSARIAVSG